MSVVTGPSESLASIQDQTCSHDAAVNAAVAEIVEKRAAIEQAKGMLMLVYGIDADAAFDLLRWQSQHHNVKLRLIAEQIALDFRQASREQPPVDRHTFDELFVTAYTRTGSPLLTDAVNPMAARMTMIDVADG